MDTLERALREAADLAPDGLAVDESGWTEASWRRGRRQRRLRQATTTGGVVAALVVVAGLVLSMTVGVPRASVPADGGDGARSGVASFPQRIGHQWWVRDLPMDAGPMAALVAVSGRAGQEEWQAVDAGGTRYHLASAADLGGTYPAISDDGTRIGWLDGAAGYAVVDLLSGDVVHYPQLGIPQTLPDDPPTLIGGAAFGAQMQMPARFSPSGRSIAVSAFRPGTEAEAVGGVVVLGDDGSVTTVDGMNQATGWLDEDRLLGRSVPPTDLAAWDREVDLVVWDRATALTTATRTLTLPDPGKDLANAVPGQWWGTLRSDGTLWVEVDVHPDTETWSQRTRRIVGFDVASGQHVDRSGRPTSDAGFAPELPRDGRVDLGRQWRGLVPLVGTDGGVRQVSADGRILSVVQADDLEVSQVVFARDAIEGSPAWTPFGTTDLLVLWWWKEVLLAAVVLAGWRWWLRTRRARPRAGAASPPSPGES